MGMGTCPAKRRSRGGRTGAEDGETWAETVRRGAVDRVGVEYTKAYTKAAWTWRLEGWGIGKGLHELGYREDHNLTLEYGVKLLLPLPGVPECYPSFPVRMPDRRRAQVCPLPGMFPDCA
jgi:hypothetical protein